MIWINKYFITHFRIYSVNSFQNLFNLTLLRFKWLELLFTFNVRLFLSEMAHVRKYIN